MSHDEPRFFDNPFPKFDQTKFPLNTLLDASGKKLNPSWEQLVLKCVHALLERLEIGVKQKVDASDYSIYTGTAGIALLYMLCAKNLSANEKSRATYYSKASDLVLPIVGHLKKRRMSFLCGDPGFLCVSALLLQQKGENKLSTDLVKRCVELSKVVSQDKEIPDELLFGRAGYLYSLLFLRKHFGAEYVDQALIEKLTNDIVESGKRLSTKTRSGAPLMFQWHDSFYLGAAHGLAGIFFVLMLLDSSTYSKHQVLRGLVESSLDYLLTIRFPSGNFPSSLGSERDRLVHWCHGAPGFIHTMILAYKVFGKAKYLDAAKGCAEVIWTRGLLRKGYGLCHGVAGNAYGLLMMWQLTKEPKYLYQALRFAEWIFDYGKHGCRQADRPFSLFEGLAGTLYFLVDLLSPTEAKFPALYL